MILHQLNNSLLDCQFSLSIILHLSSFSSLEALLECRGIIFTFMLIFIFFKMPPQCFLGIQQSLEKDERKFIDKISLKRANKVKVIICKSHWRVANKNNKA